MADAGDPFDLERFVRAQDGTYPAALAELRAGRKTGHWIWFVFPQIAGLGRSPMSIQFALSGLDEARAYLAHPVLGPRLRESCEALLAHADRGPETILGTVDALKVRSSVTLFLLADPGGALLRRVLEELFGGVADSRTEALLRDG